MKLTPQQLDQYHETGYLIIPCPSPHTLTLEQREVLWLNRDFELDPKWEKERERELGKVKWSVV